jgi:hypothetical protein
MRSSQTNLTVMFMLIGLVLICPTGFQAFGSDSDLDRDKPRHNCVYSSGEFSRPYRIDVTPQM